MRGDQSEVEQVTFSVFYLIEVEMLILLKTPPESDQWLQSYEELKDSQNNRKQKKFIPFSGCISLSMLPTSICWLIPQDRNTNIVLLSSV